MPAMVGGWAMSAVYSSFSGQFLTPQWTGPDTTGTAFSSSRTAAQVTIRPDQLQDPNLPGDRRSVNGWFDATAFGAPSQGSFGSSAKGGIKGPGSSILNTGLTKRFDLSERLRLRWEMTATNFFNHPNWDTPRATLTSPPQVT